MTLHVFNYYKLVGLVNETSTILDALYTGKLVYEETFGE